MSWQSHVDQLLYEGEDVLADTQGREAGVVVTSHRVLVFTPKIEGPNLRAVERPNVTGVSKRASGDTRWLTAGAKWLATGLALAIVGLLLDLDGIIGEVSTDGTAGQVGVGWVTELFGVFNTVFSLLDDLLLFGGLLSMVAGLGLFGWYWQTRADVLEIGIAGGADIEIPGVGFRSAAIDTLQDAIEPETTEPGSNGDDIDADGITFPNEEPTDGEFGEADPFEPAVADDSNRSNR